MRSLFMFKPLMSCLLLILPSLVWASADNSSEPAKVEPAKVEPAKLPDQYTFNIGGFYANSDSYMVVTNPKMAVLSH